MTHNFVYNNGYKSCIECGECEKIDYWNEDLNYEVINRETYRQSSKRKLKNSKWKRYLHINNRYLTNTSHLIHRKILDTLNIIPLSSKTKKKLYKYMINKKFKSSSEINEAFYNIICIHDFPITSTEFINMLNIDKTQKFKPLTKLKNTNVRKYYWYITKQIEKARKMLNFSYEESQQVYKIVFNYYNLIRFKMLKSTNPIHLIHNLVYYTIREKLQPNQRHFNKINFEIINLSYITYLIGYLREIKISGLDSNFIETLQISKRNIKPKPILNYQLV